jgi:hypothetical protein
VFKRWREHRGSKRPDMPISRAMRKHGPDAFDYRIEAELPTFEEAKLAEMIAVATRRPVFNATMGGDGTRGAVRTPAQRAKLAEYARARGTKALTEAARQANTGRHHSEERKARISAGNRGKTVSAETGARISAAKTGVPLKSGHDAQWRATMSAKLKGRTFSPETIERMRVAAKARWVARKAKQCP